MPPGWKPPTEQVNQFLLNEDYVNCISDGPSDTIIVCHRRKGYAILDSLRLKPLERRFPKEVPDYVYTANTNGIKPIDAFDDATADDPGLFVAHNINDDDGDGNPDYAQDTKVNGEKDLKPWETHMILSPEPTVFEGYDYVRWVELGRDARNVNVWRTDNKDNWKQYRGKILYENMSNAWDLNNTVKPESYEKWKHDKKSLFAEGAAIGSTRLTLKLKLNNGNVVITDTLMVHCRGVDILVNEPKNTDYDDLENNVVCRRSQSPANRPAIPCRVRLAGNDQAMTVFLENGGGEEAGQIRFGKLASQATSQNLSLHLQAGGQGNTQGSWVDFFVSGEKECKAMRDAVIRIRKDNADGEIIGEANLTVLWVNVKGRNKGDWLDEPLYEHKNNVTKYMKRTSGLGVHLTGEEDGESREAYGGIQIRSIINPSNIDLKKPMPEKPRYTPPPPDSSLTVNYGFVNKRLVTSIVLRDTILDISTNQSDDSPFFEEDDPDNIYQPTMSFQDLIPDFDPSNQELIITDADAPSTGTIREAKDVRHYANFTQWVTFTYKIGGKKEIVRCSDNYAWSVKLRIEPGGNNDTDSDKVAKLWKYDKNGNGKRDPEDDFPNDGSGENEVYLNQHITFPSSKKALSQ